MRMRYVMKRLLVSEGGAGMVLAEPRGRLGDPGWSGRGGCGRRGAPMLREQR